MYDHHLDAFIAVADSGSFLKASERLSLSPNALRKQIALLEQDLGLTLFSRSVRGVELTPSGKYIYQSAKRIIQESQEDIQRAKELSNETEAEIRIGVSLMNPADILLKRWAKIASQFPNFHVSVHPFEDTVESFSRSFSSLGTSLDLIGVVYDKQKFVDEKNMTFLRKIPVRIAMSYNNPLASKDSLTLMDLRGNTLLLPRREKGSTAESIKNYLEKDSEIRLAEVPTFDYSTFNDVSKGNSLLLSCDNWANVNPFLKTVPVDWDATFDYCLLHAPSPSPTVLKFIQALKKRF